MKLRIILLLAVVCSTAYLAINVEAQATAIAFPNCEGYGCETRHAYEFTATPTICYITNLNNSGNGSLRAFLQGTDDCVSTSRIGICEVSGYVNLSTAIEINDPYILYNMSPCPSPGLSTRYDYIYLSAFDTDDAHDIVVKHTRARITNLNGTSALGNRGCMSVEHGDYNVVFDHNSCGWHTDNGMSAYQNGTHDVTFSNNLVGEGLPVDSSVQGNCAFLAVGGTGSVLNIAWIKNFCLHTPKENRSGPGTWHNTESVAVNNAFYNFGSAVGRGFLSESGNAPIGGFSYHAVVGNWWIRGPNVQASVYSMYWYGTCGNAPAATFGVYLFDNAIEGANIASFTNCGGANPLVGSPPSQLDGLVPTINTLSSGSVLAYLSANAGARPADRDSMDTRLISEFASRGGSMKTLTTWGEGSPGTFPTLAENCIDHNVADHDTACADGEHQMPASPHDDDDSDGYTNLEEWFHAWDCEVEGGSNCWASTWSLWSIGSGASGAADTSATTIATSTTLDITTGQLVMVCTYNNGDQPATVADGGGNTLTSLQRITDPGGTMSIQLHYHVAPATATRTYTATFGASSPTRRIYVLPFTTTGEAPVLETGTAIGQGASGTTITSGNMSPTGDQTLMAFACARASGGATQGNPHEVNEVTAQFTDSISGLYVWTSVNLSSFTGDLDTDIPANTYTIVAAAFESAPEIGGGDGATAVSMPPRAVGRNRGRIR